MSRVSVPSSWNEGAREQCGPSYGAVVSQWPQCVATQLRASFGCLEQCNRCWSPVLAI